MRSGWLPVVIVVVVLGGCASESAPPAEKKSADHMTDDFNLPLVIVIETPEVPKEIQGPSPPIKVDLSRSSLVSYDCSAQRS